MKLLIVASYNKNRFAPFIVEQAEAIAKIGVEVDYFGVTGKGIKGYLGNLGRLKQKIKEFKPDIIHAHYGLSGLLANLQRKIPVVTTYHGSDINDPKVLRLSKIAIRLSAWNIFVSEKCVKMSGVASKYSLLPCGVDLDKFQPRSKQEARKVLDWDNDGKYVLFAGAFDNEVKNASLAKAAVSLLPGVTLVEMKGFSRDQVANLFYAADAFLMTSFMEGSPQVIKEAMVCGCPIVSVDVGDVAEVINGVEGCCIVDRSANNIAEKIKMLILRDTRIAGVERIVDRGLDNSIIAEKLLGIYKDVINK